MEKKPTQNIAALNQFLKGDDLRAIADLDKNKSLALQAEVFLRKAVQLDSTYVAPYIGLGWNYIVWHSDLDSGLYFANRALHFDNKNPGALGLKGWIFMTKGMYKESEQVLQQAIKYNPNDGVGYQMLGTLGYCTGDYAKSIEYDLKALKLTTDKHGNGNILKGLCLYLYLYGFYEEGLKFAEIQIEQNNDSLPYYMGLTYLDIKNKNYASALQNSIKTENWKSANFWWSPFFISLITKENKTALSFLSNCTACTDAGFKESIRINRGYNFWYAYLINGEREKANHYSEEDIKFRLKIIERQNPDSICEAYFNLMYVYSAVGNEAKAMESLKTVSACKDYKIEPMKLFELKNHPIFEFIRAEPDFQQIIAKNEARIQPEMKKIEKILQDYWSEN
jgi:tetratricopeptide (TPR) repeat protein